MTTCVKCRLSIMAIVMLFLCVNTVKAQTIAKKATLN